MCQLLNMEDSVDEIIQHLGMVRDGVDGQIRGHISFEDFMRCRLELGNEIEHEQLVLDGGLMHHGMYTATVDSVSGDVPLRTASNHLGQGEKTKNIRFSSTGSLSKSFACHRE